jgi:hypothetical protein
VLVRDACRCPWRFRFLVPIRRRGLARAPICLFAWLLGMVFPWRLFDLLFQDVVTRVHRVGWAFLAVVAVVAVVGGARLPF